MVRLTSVAVSYRRSRPGTGRESYNRSCPDNDTDSRSTVHNRLRDRRVPAATLADQRLGKS